MWCKSFILYIHFLFKHEQKNESLTEGQDPRKLFYCYWLSFFLTKFAWRCTSKRSDKRNLCMLPGNSSYTDRFVHLSLWFLLWLCYYSLLFFNILLWSFSAYTELKSQWYLIYDFRSCMVLAWDQAPQWENGAVLSLPQSPATLASLADLPTRFPTAEPGPRLYGSGSLMLQKLINAEKSAPSGFLTGKSRLGRTMRHTVFRLKRQMVYLPSCVHVKNQTTYSYLRLPKGITWHGLWYHDTPLNFSLYKR